MAPQTYPRAQRRRSSCRSFLCILILAWAVIMVGSNIARVLMLPEFFVRVPPRAEVVQPPNYYQMLGVTPLVDSTTLRKLRTKYTRELHPDKVGDDPEAINTLLIAQEAFETLQDDRRRCEYDKAHRIKGKWPIQTCRNAFRDEYREIEREMYEKYLEALEEKGKARRTWGSREGDESEWSSRESESTRSYRMRSEGRQPEPEKRSSVPPATARVEDEPDDVLNAVVTGLAWGAEGVVAFLGGACAVVTYHFGLLLRFLGSPFNATDV